MPDGCNWISIGEKEKRMHQDAVTGADSLQQRIQSPPATAPQSTQKIDSAPFQDETGASLIPADTLVNPIMENKQPLFGRIWEELTWHDHKITGFGLSYMAVAALFDKEKPRVGWMTCFFFALPLSYLCALFLCIRSFRKNALHTLFMKVITILGLIFLLLFMGCLRKDALYGYWVTVGVWILNLFLLWRGRKRFKEFN